jgi:hypothetical protein
MGVGCVGHASHTPRFPLLLTESLNELYFFRELEQQVEHSPNSTRTTPFTNQFPGGNKNHTSNQPIVRIPSQKNKQREKEKTRYNQM